MPPRPVPPQTRRKNRRDGRVSSLSPHAAVRYHPHMAIRVTREVVCDLGERHTGEIRHWRVTVDKETKTFDLCPACSKPLTKLWGGSPGARVTGRMRVVSMSEIEAQKKVP